MKFLVIGGDAAGMSAASRAKRNNPDLDITVLEKTMDVSYSACGMPYNIADSNRNIEDLVVRQASVFQDKQGINILTGHCVESIHPLSKTVAGISLQENKFRFSYDKLLIATGGSPIIPDLSGFDLPGVLALKSLDDKSYLTSNTVKKAVIIGMGYIGLEMCEALRARSIEVDMVKPGPVFLPWMEKEMSDVVRNEVETNKVKLYPGHALQKIHADGPRLQVICSDLILEADMVLVAIGIKPNSELASGAGLDLGRIPLALRANRAGWAVADNICGKAVELPGVAGTAVFKVFDLEVARTGLTMKEATDFGFEPATVMIKTRSRAHAHPGASVIHVLMIGDKKSRRLLGAQMVGKEGVAHRINAIAVALHARMTVEEYCQTDLAYAPPFGPVWDPTLTAANQLLKKI